MFFYGSLCIYVYISVAKFILTYAVLVVFLPHPLN